MTNSLAQEAANCRATAAEFKGRPERPFLLRLSEAFDELARREEKCRPAGSDEAVSPRPPTAL